VKRIVPILKSGYSTLSPSKCDVQTSIRLRRLDDTCYKQAQPDKENAFLRWFLISMNFLFLVLGVQYGMGQQSRPPIGIMEKLGTTVPMDVELYDESGNLVLLQSIINKPTIVTFVYYKCPGICSPLLTEVTKVVEKMDLELGKDYQILTLSFDDSEKPEMAAEKRDNYLGEIKRPVNPAGWRFYTGDSANIHRFTDATGFYFLRNGRDWIHAGALIALSPQGKVTRYLYGVKQVPFDVKMAIIEASEGRTGPTIAKVLNFCYAYDPEGKRYVFDVVRVSGVVIVGLVGVFVAIFIVRKPKKEKV
jgi:protein SCO1